MSTQRDNDSISQIVDNINAFITNNFVHTLQFVSIDRTDERKLAWKTRSADAKSYNIAVDNFTGIADDSESDEVKRTLLYEQFDKPFWESKLGDRILLAELPKYVSFERSALIIPAKDRTKNEPPPGGLTSSVDDLLKYWDSCLSNVFHHSGYAMWIHQDHTNTEGNKINSSIFILFSKELKQDEKDNVTRTARYFIIQHIIDVYTNWAIRELKLQESDLAKLQLAHSEFFYFSEKLMRQLNDLRTVLNNNLTTLISGPIGSGKSALARHIFEKTKRTGENFFSFNFYTYDSEPDCVKSYLDTNLSNPRTGTLLLDDIHLLPTNLQAHLQHFLETRHTFPKSAKPIAPNTALRLILTIDDGELLDSKKTKTGSLLRSLAYRIDVFHIALKALAYRRDELEQLSLTIIDRLNDDYPYEKRKTLSLDAIEALRSHDYPGNVMELYCVLLRSYIYSKNSDIIGVDDLRFSSLPNRNLVTGIESENEAGKHQDG